MVNARRKIEFKERIESSYIRIACLIHLKPPSHTSLSSSPTPFILTIPPSRQARSPRGGWAHTALICIITVSAFMGSRTCTYGYDSIVIAIFLCSLESHFPPFSCHTVKNVEATFAARKFRQLEPIFVVPANETRQSCRMLGRLCYALGNFAEFWSQLPKFSGADTPQNFYRVDRKSNEDNSYKIKQICS